MKAGRHLFAQLEECTGCRLCVYACSLRVSGCFAPARSILRVLGSEELARFYPAIVTSACPCADGQEMCVEACPHDVLRFVDDHDIPTFLRRAAGFAAAPVVDAAGAALDAEVPPGTLPSRDAER